MDSEVIKKKNEHCWSFVERFKWKFTLALVCAKQLFEERGLKNNTYTHTYMHTHIDKYTAYAKNKPL